MKRLLLILILTFSFQTLTKADDISDFEIEGMSIGDSLLDYLSKSEIKKIIKITKNHYKYLKDPTKYREAYIFQPNNFKTYQTASLMFRQNDDNYTIMFVRGMKDYIENLNGCFSQLNEIAKEIETSISNFTKDVREGKSKLDKSGKSISYNTYYTLSSGDAIMLTCNNWDEKLRKKNNWTEGLSVIVRTKEVGNWLQGN
jgi:hypothetical protein